MGMPFQCLSSATCSRGFFLSEANTFLHVVNGQMLTLYPQQMEAYILIFFLRMTVFLMASKAAVCKRKFVPLQTSSSAQKEKKAHIKQQERAGRLCWVNKLEVTLPSPPIPFLLYPTPTLFYREDWKNQAYIASSGEYGDTRLHHT